MLLNKSIRVAFYIADVTIDGIGYLYEFDYLELSNIFPYLFKKKLSKLICVRRNLSLAVLPCNKEEQLRSISLK